MKLIAMFLLLGPLHLTIHAADSGHYLTPIEVAASLKIVATTFTIDDTLPRRTVTTLGTIQSTSASRIEAVVVEINYFDAKKNLIDTIAQPLHNIMLEPSSKLSFRVMDEVAQAKEAYSSQTIRITSARSRNSEANEQESFLNSAMLERLFLIWGPMLPLICLFIYWAPRVKRQDSPHGRMLMLIERQNELLQRQFTILGRITEAVEAMPLKSEGLRGEP